MNYLEVRGLPWQPGQGLVGPQKVQQTENEASEGHRGGCKAESRNWRPAVNSQNGPLRKNPEVFQEHYPA